MGGGEVCNTTCGSGWGGKGDAVGLGRAVRCVIRRVGVGGGWGEGGVRGMR